MKGSELLIVAALTLILVISLAITIPVELAGREHSAVKKIGLEGGKALRYFVIGDYGEYDKHIEETQPVQLVAHAMSNASSESPIDFIATTGDNVYPNGMEDIFDWRQFTFMYSVFDQPGLAGKPWFPVLGNHDCITPKPMLEANDVYPMWNMPSSYYNLTVLLDNNSTAAFIFLDGCTLTCESIPNFPPPDFCADYKYNDSAISEQYRWLTTVLMDSAGVDWIIVHIHMPPFSSGSDNGDSEALKEKLYPTLNQFGVDLLITGHEHLMQYFYVPPNSTYAPQYNSTDCGSYTAENSYYKFPGQNSVIFQKGNGLQEIVIGSSGHPMDQLCPERVSHRWRS